MRYVIPEEAPARDVVTFTRSDYYNVVTSRRDVCKEAAYCLEDKLSTLLLLFGVSVIAWLANPVNLNIVIFLGTILTCVLFWTMVLSIAAARWDLWREDCLLYEYWLHNLESQKGQPHLWGLMSNHHTRRVQRAYIRFYTTRSLARRTVKNNKINTGEITDKIVLVLINRKGTKKNGNRNK